MNIKEALKKLEGYSKSTSKQFDEIKAISTVLLEIYKMLKEM